MRESNRYIVCSTCGGSGIVPHKSTNSNSVQFARLIAELDIMGAFTPEVLHELKDSMNYEFDPLTELIAAARLVWARRKQVI